MVMPAGVTAIMPKISSEIAYTWGDIRRQHGASQRPTFAWRRQLAHVSSPVGLVLASLDLKRDWRPRAHDRKVILRLFSIAYATLQISCPASGRSRTERSRQSPCRRGSRIRARGQGRMIICTTLCWSLGGKRKSPVRSPAGSPGDLLPVSPPLHGRAIVIYQGLTPAKEWLPSWAVGMDAGWGRYVSLSYRGGTCTARRPPTAFLICWQPITTSHGRHLTQP